MWIAPRVCDVDYKCKSDMGCDQSQQSLNCFCTIYKPLELPIIICCMLLIGYLPHALPVFYGCAMLFRREVLELQFNLERRDRRRREYALMEEGDDESIMEILQPIVKQNQSTLSMGNKLEVGAR